MELEHTCVLNTFALQNVTIVAKYFGLTKGI